MLFSLSLFLSLVICYLLPFDRFPQCWATLVLGRSSRPVHLYCRTEDNEPDVKSEQDLFITDLRLRSNRSLRDHEAHTHTHTENYHSTGVLTLPVSHFSIFANERCSNQLLNLVPPIRVFPVETWFTKYLEFQVYLLEIPDLSSIRISSFPSIVFFVLICILSFSFWGESLWRRRLHAKLRYHSKRVRSPITLLR